MHYCQLSAENSLELVTVLTIQTTETQLVFCADSDTYWTRIEHMNFSTNNLCEQMSSNQESSFSFSFFGITLCYTVVWSNEPTKMLCCDSFPRNRL